MTSTMLIEPEELKSRLGDHKLIVLDASWYLPNMNRDARAEYEQAHIPGAVFYDIDLHSDPDSDLPHMLPSPTAFAKSAGNLGISSEHKIVVYDGAGLFSAARVWWAFRLMGAEDVRILNGGLPAWNEAGYRLEVGDVSRDPTTFNARFNQGAVRSIQDVVGAIETADAQIVDARAAARFRGEAPEPRAGLRSGHMPGAFNIPVDTLLSGGRLKPVEELKEAFLDAGVDLDQPIITSCGSGVTAAVLSLALETIGHKETALYDGSWSEWGGAPDVEVVTGEVLP